MNFKIEQSFEDAVGDFLGGIDGYTLFKGFDENNLLTPRIEVEVSGLEFDETLDETGESQPEYAKFDLNIEVRLVTNMDDGTSRSTHYDGIQSVREKFLRSADNFTPTNLPDHNVSYIRLVTSANAINGSMRITSSEYQLRASCLLS